ncbi:hypothetical protein PPERSA_11226 [Pseudocohnilembus persalinus]|uniref:Phospholipid/glycerol acyltransferase domain-containing protein n=1 Tax=Pseudocohnilembus persalinus TaxID=266149 RepID=A0A0V0R020_PSEPJ|nr:hypothetical protein PPERSA_11226 [Pseudocohnilembus persalinus]|eukprot:KRX07677.1 hypothetical protein PPERSA_11226 [Pseudocohnilembus persalinus]
MLLLNHRSWSDFFIHDVVTDYTANFVSRMAVGIIFPTILLLSHLTRSIWFFKRGNKGSLESLFTWFGLKWRQAYRKNVIVYPEGHRMYGAEKPSYLKKGMIGYAFRNKVDCQIIITFGNDKVCDEKSLKLRANQTVYSYTTDVIKPQNFGSEG